ncbi:hypothetical protein FHX82_002553 [Amycolatopsis bartoniae]|nr:hypothetical protein [Amycolatopsis bartoniae]MBB2935499.1 hypothetical protein [Amycolatopsis bartoniae]
MGRTPRQPGARAAALSGTVHGNVIQAGEVHHTGLPKLLRRLFGRS